MNDKWDGGHVVCGDRGSGWEGSSSRCLGNTKANVSTNET